MVHTYWGFTFLKLTLHICCDALVGAFCRGLFLGAYHRSYNLGDILYTTHSAVTDIEGMKKVFGAVVIVS